MTLEEKKEISDLEFIKSEYKDILNFREEYKEELPIWIRWIVIPIIAGLFFCLISIVGLTMVNEIWLMIEANSIDVLILDAFGILIIIFCIWIIGLIIVTAIKEWFKTGDR